MQTLYQRFKKIRVSTSDINKEKMKTFKEPEYENLRDVASAKEEFEQELEIAKEDNIKELYYKYNPNIEVSPKSYWKLQSYRDFKAGYNARMKNEIN